MSVEMAIELKTLGNYKAVLGESPVYDMEKNKLFWVGYRWKK
jgi:SMP-30/Gluconolaconase/LRE-like region.